MFFDGVGGNNFVGGGFMPSQAAPELQSNSGAQAGQRTTNSRNQTLRALTIKHLMKSIANTTDDFFTVDGTELNNITVVGKVLSVNESSAVLALVVEDGTGRADVKYWISSDENEPVPRHRAIQPGMYVKLHGHVRSMDNKKHIVAFKIKKIEDFNEVTHHYLDCIFQHSYITKKAQGMLNGAGGFGGASTIGGSMSAGRPAGAAGGQYGGNATQAKPGSWGGSSFGGQQQPAAAAGPQGSVGGGACEQEVMAIYNSSEVATMKYGMHQDRVIERLAHKYQPQQILGAIQFCLAEGHIYSTTDDNTFKTTMMG